MNNLVAKTLQVAEAVILAVPRIRPVLGDRWPEFCAFLRQLHDNLQKGPHPEFSDPLLEAIAWGFPTPIEPILSGILTANRFDYRFITGRPRHYRQLRKGSLVTLELIQLWQRVQGKSAEMMAREPGCREA
ncbi:MAG: hypothetical protein HQL82_12885 [Magnetococcales bacterium]|nr:hypothetical protein [Magnetococcales bacterium]